MQTSPASRVLQSTEGGIEAIIQARLSTKDHISFFLTINSMMSSHPSESV